MKSRILARRITYTAKAFSVEKIDLMLPNGKVTEYDRLTHSGAVTIVPFDDSGNVLFVRQFRVGAQTELLELPAGTLGQNEDPLECAKREVREETGMQAGKLTLLGDFFLAPGYSTEYMYVYLAEELSSNPLPGDEDEFLEVERIPWERVIQMVAVNQIKDGKTLAALFLVLKMSKEGNECAGG